MAFMMRARADVVAGIVLGFLAPGPALGDRLVRPRPGP
jgi:hypothetical protein